MKCYCPYDLRSPLFQLFKTLTFWSLSSSIPNIIFKQTSHTYLPQKETDLKSQVLKHSYSKSPKEHKKPWLRLFFNGGWSSLITSKTLTYIMLVTRITIHSCIILAGLFLGKGMGTIKTPSALTSCFVLFLLHRVYMTVTIGAIASGEANYCIILSVL